MGRLYAILRAAFMSDEPVRGAPSIDAFSFRSQRVTRGTSTLRHIVLLLLFSLSPFHYPSIRASVHSVLLHACNQIISISLQRVRTYIRTYVYFLLLAPKGRSSTKLHLSAGGTAGNTISSILRNIPDEREYLSSQ